MLRTAGWLTRAVALVAVGVGTFLHSSATTSVLAAQAAAFGLGVAMMGVWAVSDFRRPATAARDRMPPSPLALAALAVAAAAGGVCASPGGVGLIAFGIMAALAAGSETSLITGWVITAIGAVAIEVGVLVWSASTAAALGLPLALIVGLLSGQTRRSYRLQAEQAAALLAQVEQLRAEQRQVAVLNERSRIAREIHDVLAHSLGALGIQIQAARAVLTDQRDIDRALGLLDQAQRIAGDGLGETRRAIHALRSDAGPLPQELTRLAEAYHARHQMPVTVSVSGEVRTLPPDAALARQPGRGVAVRPRARAHLGGTDSPGQGGGRRTGEPRNAHKRASYRSGRCDSRGSCAIDGVSFARILHDWRRKSAICSMCGKPTPIMVRPSPPPNGRDG
jgi:signal transduction histidine kinase